MKKLIILNILFSLSCIGQIKPPDSLKLFFDSAKYELTDYHKSEIERFFKSIKTADVQKIRIKGYTDFVGNHVYNNKLSKQRAKSAYQYIITNFSFASIAQQGLGELDELEDQNVEDGISKHRKVDIILSYEKPKPVVLHLTRKQKYLKRLIDLSSGEKIRLLNVHFQISTAIAVKDSELDIDGLYKILKAYPKLKVQIEGHVCCGSREEYEEKTITKDNLSLSDKRAKFIFDALIKKGISKARLSYVGYGFSRPLEYPEDVPDKQKENRRIEVKVID